MRRESIAALRDHMNLLADSGQNQRFNWEQWTGWVDLDVAHERGDPSPGWVRRSCGTTACVAGWAVALLDKRNRTLNRHGGDYFDAGTNLLALDRSDAGKLFYPDEALRFGGLHDSWDGYTEELPPRAVAMVLDHLLKTGTVDWSIIGPRRCFDTNGNEVTTW